MTLMDAVIALVGAAAVAAWILVRQGEMLAEIVARSHFCWQSGPMSPVLPHALALLALGCGARTGLGDLRAEGGGGSAPVEGCGDGVLDEGEQCDEGARNAERPALSLINPGVGAEPIPITPVVTPDAAAAFYGYDSHSAHTGFEQAFSSVLFLHRQAGQSSLDLFTIHGIDQESSGLDAGDCAMTQRFSGLPPGWSVALSDDDHGELVALGPDSAFGSWEWHHNSDGGVISGLPFPGNWTIRIDSELEPCAPSWELRDGSGEALELAPPVSWLQAFDSASTCRTDCTIPFCGDGIADGGELCDDGNGLSGDGCASDCTLEE